MKKFPSVLAAALMLAALPALAQGNDLSKVEIKPQKVAGSVTLLQGAGGNIGVCSGADGVLMVDDQYLPMADKIMSAIKQISPTGKIAFLVNTHHHGDHTGGNAMFGRYATILAQTNVRKRLGEASPKEALPVITFEDGVTIWFNGEEIEIVHLPHGHTDGDSVLFFKGSNVVHMGDHFFNGMFPFIDTSSGGDVAGYVKNVADMIARIPTDAKIIPGHGPLGTLEDLKKFHTMMVKTIDVVRQEVAEGVSLADAKKAGLPDEWKAYDWNFVGTEKWIETVYTSLKK